MPGSSGSSYLWSQIITAGKNLPDDWINNFLFLPALCKWFWLGWDPRKAWEEKQSKSREMIIRWNKHGHVLKAAWPFAALGKHTLVTSLFPALPIAPLRIQSQLCPLTRKLIIMGLQRFTLDQSTTIQGSACSFPIELEAWVRCLWKEKLEENHCYQ